ncbi:MAG TPA: CoA transferase [Dehalococcoidia bacterium]
MAAEENQEARHPGRRRYACADGAIEIAVEGTDQWHALAVCLGRPELAYEGSWEAARRAPADGPLAAVIASMLAEDTAQSWRRRLTTRGVPCVTVQAE